MHNTLASAQHFFLVDAKRRQEVWIEIYGYVLKFHSRFGFLKLLTVDPVAISHLLRNSDTFQKSEFLRISLGTSIGEGLLLGPRHRKQRKVMNPALGPAQGRTFTFVEQSVELREIWADVASTSPRRDGRLYTRLSKITLDTIELARELIAAHSTLATLNTHSESLTGFNHTLHSLDEKQNNIYDAIHSILTGPARDIILAPQLFFPAFRSIPAALSFQEIQHIGSRLIEDSKAAVLAERSANVVEKQDVQGHDFRGLLVKSNIAADMSENMRTTDSEILSQVPTSLLAGHKTTSTAVAWTLFALSYHPAVQAVLRAELHTCPIDFPAVEQLNSLLCLKSVVRESLHPHSPVSFTQRVASHDGVIPRQKSFTDKHGVLQDTIQCERLFSNTARAVGMADCVWREWVVKGDFVGIPIRLLNRSTEAWAEDPNEFRPERWESLPEAVNALPSVYCHLMTFIAGAHACIGYRFTVVEIKALLFTLVRMFEFELALSAEDIVGKSGIVSRPVIA